MMIERPNAGQEADKYFDFHRRRYQFLVQVLAPLLAPGVRVLDIGLSALPRILRREFPQIKVSTLGFVDQRYWTPGEWPHIECDLNDPAFPWTTIGKYDVIILGEVLEHLYSPPQKTLHSLRSILQPTGHLLIQTPNAVSLEKRIKVVCGMNPYEMIRDDSRNPGHYREYTVRELIGLARGSGFSVSSLAVKNYFNPEHLPARVYNRICYMLPPSLRDGITLVLRAE
jgi:SAM-dependent methyltransferase